LNAVRLARYLWQVAAATFLVAVCPVLAVWWLRTSGTIDTAPVGMIFAIGLSLGASYVGGAFWETRTSSGDLLFGELMVWGFVRRWLNERRLAAPLPRTPAARVLSRTAQRRTKRPTRVCEFGHPPRWSKRN